MTLKCAVCSQALLQVPVHGRVNHVCAQGHGRALPTSVVRQWLKPESRPIFDRALTRVLTGTRPCPRCRLKMKVLHFEAGMSLDHCEKCLLTWFDHGEHESLMLKNAEEINRQEEGVAAIVIEPGIDFRPNLFPYENLRGNHSKLPFVTILLIISFSLITQIAKSKEFNGFIFSAAAPWDGFGLPALLSIFSHADSSHLIGNCVFFFLPGALVESTLGETVLLEIFFISAFAGLFAAAVFQPGIFLLGASAGISGVFTVLCLTQPKAIKVWREVQFVWQMFSFFTITYRVPMWMIYATWIATQALGHMNQKTGRGDMIDYLGHLAGAIAGAAYVFATDLKVLTPVASRRNT